MHRPFRRNDQQRAAGLATDFAAGQRWTLEDGVYRTALWAEGGSPNGTAKGPPQAKVEHWAVRRWVSTTYGPVTVSGHAAKLLPWGPGGQARVVFEWEAKVVS